MSTIWQRFGRCVRDKALTGDAILFTDKENLDPERQRKAERARTRKRPASNKQGVDISSKRQKGTGATDLIKSEEQTVELLDVSSSEDEQANQSNGDANKRILDSDVDELINAEHRGRGCRRIPIMNAFQDNQSGAFYFDFH